MAHTRKPYRAARAERKPHFHANGRGNFWSGLRPHLGPSLQKKSGASYILDYVITRMEDTKLRTLSQSAK